jgi:ATP-dependent helicase/nuclease subunit A
VVGAPGRPRFLERDEPVLGLAIASSEHGWAGAVADEVGRILDTVSVRDRQSGAARGARPGDIAILFRARASHRACEQALEARGIRTYVYKGLGFFDADEIQDLQTLIRFLARPASPVRIAAFLRSRFVRLSDPGLLALSGDLVSAVLDAREPAGLGSLDAADRRALSAVRAAVPRWLARVDRVPPADLVDDVLRETGYDLELRGLRATQARENVKKLRGLVRRLANRGGLTFSRLADHLERLSAGDESNAILDAADAVNLMTVHAAKGLEFPIVFVVDLGRGTGGGPVVRVSTDGEDGPAVTIAGLSPHDPRQREADREEAKRLLYVALTRARDRLYLAATVRANTLPSARGSLADVLPRSLLETLAGAARAPLGDGRLVWQAAPDRNHVFRRCPVPQSAASQSTE